MVAKTICIDAMTGRGYQSHNRGQRQQGFDGRVFAGANGSGRRRNVNASRAGGGAEPRERTLPDALRQAQRGRYQKKILPRAAADARLIADYPIRSPIAQASDRRPEHGIVPSRNDTPGVTAAERPGLGRRNKGAAPATLAASMV